MAVVELTTSQTAGGLATNPDGSLADVPRALASHMHDELMQVIALLHGVCETVMSDTSGDAVDANGLTSPSSRAATLASIADDKVVAIVRSLAPYV
jgi:hypothetical protein